MQNLLHLVDNVEQNFKKYDDIEIGGAAGKYKNVTITQQNNYSPALLEEDASFVTACDKQERIARTMIKMDLVKMGFDKAQVTEFVNTRSYIQDTNEAIEVLLGMKKS